MKLTQRDYQKLGTGHLLNHDRCALWARPGMGKSSMTAAALDVHYLLGETHPTLILAPKRVAEHTWPAEFAKWDDFNHLEVSPIVGTQEDRIAAINRDVPIYTTNYEQLEWLAEYHGGKWPYRIVVADEATKLKNARVSVRTSPKGKRYLQAESGGAKRASLLAKLAFGPIKKFYQLTGSPATNGYKDIWGQLFFLDGGNRLGSSYGAFEQRWFHRVMQHKNDKYGTLILKPGAEEEIKSKISDITLALDPKDWFPNLQEPLRISVRVDLPASARKAYTTMEKEMFLDIGQNGVEAFSANAKTMKCRQIASGFVYEQDEQGKSTKNFHQFHDVKLDALQSIYDECGGMPLLVAYWFKPDLARLLHAFPKGVDLATKEGLRKFMAGEAPMGFGHPGSIGHGFDGLQNITSIIVFFNTDYNLEYREQIIERVGPVRQIQSGHNRKVLIYDIIANDTVDDVVLDVVEGKCTVQEGLFNAMKRKGLA